MATVDGNWHLGIGDPTPVGWLTVAAYAGAAWVCWRTAHRAPGDDSASAPSRQFWWLLALAMAGLAVNKQLDLQTAVTEIGRVVAQHGGWYQQRHQVQIVFIGLIAAAGVLTRTLLCRLSWPLSRGRGLSLAGLVFLASFVVIRAASFHHVDLFISDTVLGLRWNWIIELTGIAMVAGGAIFEHHERGTAKSWSAPKPAPRRQPPGDDRQVISRGDPRSHGR